VTEWGYWDPDTEEQRHARGVVWEAEPAGKGLTYHWGVSEERKRQIGLDFDGELQAREDCVEFRITARNPGEQPWEREHLSLVCCRSGSSPAFEDYNAERTFVCRGGEFIPVARLLDGRFADHRMCGFPVGEGDEGYERLSAKISRDGQWVLGVAVDRAGSLSFNFQRRVSCIHSNPRWGKLAPGQEVTIRGRVYLMRGTLADLYQRYCADFEVQP
jgi:hypothetical protein